MHSTKSGFRGLWWEGNPYGIHLAAGSEWMHLMHEGLGKHLLTYICAVLKKSGRNLEEFYKIHRNNIKVFFCFSGKLQKIDSYVAALDRRTSAMPSGLKKISDGLESIGTLSAMDLPGVLAQVALAIGSHSSGDLPSAVTKNVQRAIYYYFALQRERERDFPDEKSVEVGHSKTVLHISQ